VQELAAPLGVGHGWVEVGDDSPHVEVLYNNHTADAKRHACIDCSQHFKRIMPEALRTYQRPQHKPPKRQRRSLSVGSMLFTG